MALKPCRECGELVSSRAKACPHCGIKRPGRAQVSAGRGALLLLAFGMVLIFGITLSDSAPDPSVTAPAAATEAPARRPEIPSYRVVDTVDQLNGVRYGDVVAESLSQETPVEDLAIIARVIGAREGFGDLSLYCSDAAVRANFSESFSRANPQAAECILGRMEGGVFTPAL